MLLKFLVRDAARAIANLTSGNPLDLPHAERRNGTTRGGPYRLT